MNKLTLGVVEARFADIVWENAPISTSSLIKICEKELNWKRTTTYTVLKRLCEGNLFCNNNGTPSFLKRISILNRVKSL